jgi:hypothetical protein
MRFKTESGSEYHIWDDQNGLIFWERTRTTDASGDMRSERGRLLEMPTPTVGLRCALFDTSVLPGHVAHAVLTSVVTEIL